MELTKADKRQLNDVIRRGILRRCEEWLNETGAFINQKYGDDENAFDRCMEVTKRARDYYKEAMLREDYYRNSMMEIGVTALLLFLSILTDQELPSRMANLLPFPLRLHQELQ